MSKVEDIALETYPKMSRISEPHKVIPADNESHYLGDANEEKKRRFIAGYHQAEKALELTWKDIELIVNIDLDTNHEEVIIGPRKNEEHYKEVLKRFLDYKNIKKK